MLDYMQKSKQSQALFGGVTFVLVCHNRTLKFENERLIEDSDSQ